MTRRQLYLVSGLAFAYFIVGMIFLFSGVYFVNHTNIVLGILITLPSYSVLWTIRLLNKETCDYITEPIAAVNSQPNGNDGWCFNRSWWPIKPSVEIFVSACDV